LGRYTFIIGALPALMTLWVRRAIPESERWEHVNTQRRRNRERETLGAEELALARITLVDLFADPEVPRRIILASLMSPGTTFAFSGDRRLHANPMGPRGHQSGARWPAVGELCRYGQHQRIDHRLCGVRFPCRRIWAQAVTIFLSL
jgi:hypothetical protein